MDAWLFERLVREARQCSAAAPARARSLIGEALALWRGGAFAEVADEEWVLAEAARLEELRLGADELLVATTLRSAPAADAVPAAEVLTRRRPLREEGRRLLALALWGSDRQADALAALRRAPGCPGAEPRSWPPRPAWSPSAASTRCRWPSWPRRWDAALTR